MANLKVCDICGRECKPNGKYSLIYKSFLKTDEKDICNSCMEVIKSVILESQIRRVDEIKDALQQR